MDKRKHYLVVLDTETANTRKLPNGKLDASDALVYDLGFQVIDTKGNVYEQYSFTIAEIFCDVTLMKSAYYKDKISKYLENLMNGNFKLVSFLEARKKLLNVMEKYNVKEVAAHNAIFDYTALNATIRYLTKSAKRYFFPKEIIWWDTKNMAQSVIYKMPTYKKFCHENGYLTKHKTPRPQLSAEVLYKFISKNKGFEESHTGLDDVIIESQILNYCYRQKKAMKKTLFND